MAVNTSRNMNAELQEGLTDGTYKKIPPNRSNVEVPLEERRLMPWRYGFEDSRIKYRPDAGNQVARYEPRDHG